MLKLMKKYMRGKALICAILAPLFMLMEVFMDLQQPALMSDIIDIGVADGDLDYVLRTGLQMLIYAFLGVIGGAGCSVLATYASVHTGGHVRRHLFEKIQTLSLAETDQLKTSSLITRITNDVVHFQEMIMMLLRSFVRSPMLCIGGIFMAFKLAPGLAWIFCIVVPVLAVAAGIIIRRAIPMYSRVQQQIDVVNTVVRENLLGIRVVRAFTMEDQQSGRFRKENTALADHNIRAQSTTFLLMPIVTLVMNLSVVAVLWFGGNLEISGVLPTGRIMALINYMIQITNALVMVVNMIVNMSRSRASAARIQEVLDTEPSMKEPEHPCEPEHFDISFEHVSFRYGSGEYVLRDLSFTIREGQRVGIIGSTGCGKTTLTQLLAGMYDVTAGSIRIGDVDIRDIPTPVLRRKIGLVLQENLLFSGTVAENLRYGNQQATEADLTAAVTQAQAASFLMEMPDRLESPVSQRGKNFSGGQKQRLSIARTLLQKADILVLDDSMSALDFLTEARLQQALRSEVRNGTLIMVAQRVSSIIDFDKILVLDNGRLIASGNHTTLMAECELYRTICRSQLGEEVTTHAC